MGGEMVIRTPDSFGNLPSKGNVLIPCQCYYNARDDILTEIIKQSHHKITPENGSTSKNHPRHEKIKNECCTTKDVQTETSSPPCCVCEYFRNLEYYSNKKDLWNKQFNRWWGWNWQRKKKDFLSKFRRKDKVDQTCPCLESNFEDNHSKNNCFCETALQNCKEKSTNRRIESHRSEINKKTAKNINLSEPYHCIPPLTTHNFKKPYTGRRKRQKYEKLLYEGWVRDITSSESDSGIQNVKIKILTPKTSNDQDKMHYLSMRLKNINSKNSNTFVSNKKLISEDSLEEKKFDPSYNKNPINKLAPDLVNSNLNHIKDSEKVLKKNSTFECLDNKNPIESFVSNFAGSKFISPISGKYYDFNLPATTMPLSTAVNFLEPLDVNNKNIIPKPEFDSLKYYNLIKEQHKDLLKSISDVLNITKSIEKIEKPENVELGTANCNPDFNNSMLEYSVEEEKLNALIINDSQQVDVFTANNSKKENFEKEEEQTSNFEFNPIFTSKNPFQNNKIDEIIDNNNTFNLLEMNRNLFSPISSNSFHQDVNFDLPVELSPIQELEKPEKKYERNENYDINYINNNLVSFASSISDTEFLLCRTKISENTEISENISEVILQEIDLTK